MIAAVRASLSVMRIAILLLTACLLHGATVHGNVVENQSGKPLSRVLLKLAPLPGAAGTAQSVRSDSYGGFTFSDVPAGWWMLTAARENYVTVQYGQKSWMSAGAPIVLEDKSTVALHIRMPRFGAISGRVVDENDVGIPLQPMVAYRNTRPLQLVARGKADEQGRFRLYGLLPGSYAVRSGAWKDEAIDYVPTFGKETTVAEEARAVEVTLDQDVDRVEVKPLRGTLLPVEGSVSPSLPEAVKVTFASELGRETVTTPRDFRFPPVAPGVYEIYAEGPGDPQCAVVAAWLEVDLRRPHSIDFNAPCVNPTQVMIWGTGGPLADTSNFHVMARRVDRAGTGETVEVAMNRRGALLLPGRWQVMLKTPPGYCVVDFTESRMSNTRRRADGWNDLTVTGPGYVRFTVSQSPGGVHGTVTGTAQETVAGAPVFLEPVDSLSGKRVGDPVSTLTDARGQYRFRNLAPGVYRILATFEYRSPEAETMESVAQSITVSESSDPDLALRLFVL